MGLYCDLHAIDNRLHSDVSVCHGSDKDRRCLSFVMVELRVGDGCVNLFLTSDQALALAHGICSALQAADQDGKPADLTLLLGEGE